MKTVFETFPVEYHGVILMAIGIGIVVAVLVVVLLALLKIFGPSIFKFKLPETVKIDTTNIDSKIMQIQNTTDSALIEMERRFNTFMDDRIEKLDLKIEEHRRATSDDIRRVFYRIEELSKMFIPITQCDICREGGKTDHKSIEKQVGSLSADITRVEKKVDNHEVRMHGSGKG